MVQQEKLRILSTPILIFCCYHNNSGRGLQEEIPHFGIENPECAGKYFFLFRRL